MTRYGTPQDLPCTVRRARRSGDRRGLVGPGPDGPCVRPAWAGARPAAETRQVEVAAAAAAPGTGSSAAAERRYDSDQQRSGDRGHDHCEEAAERDARPQTRG